jgi:hypothetical protein
MDDSVAVEGHRLPGRRWPRLLSRANFWLGSFGFNPRYLLISLRGLPRLLREYRLFRKSLARADGSWPISLTAPCLGDWSAQSGSVSGQYFLQDLFVAQRVFANTPVKHVDVGSRVDGFVAHVAAFRQIHVVDIRPLKLSMPNITFMQCDLMRIPPELVGTADSVSCLHALEHFGLGRYGDPIDADGYRLGLDGLTQLLSKGGVLYLSVPIGRQRVEFNGHRIFAIETILAATRERFALREFSYIDDSDRLHANVPLDAAAIASNFGLDSGCGIFELVKSQ